MKANNKVKISKAVEKKSNQIKLDLKVQQVKNDISISPKDSLSDMIDSFIFAWNQTKKYVKKNDVKNQSIEYFNTLIKCSMTFLEEFNKEMKKQNSKKVGRN